MSETGQHDTFTADEQSRPDTAQPSHRKRNLIIAGAAAVVIAAGIAIGVSATSSPGTVQIHGSINLGILAAVDTTNPGASITGSDLIQAGDACEAADGYGDIAQGTTVTVGGPSGQLGVGALSAGKETSGGYCQFTFSVPVAGGQSAYTVTVSHRGTQTLSADEVKNGIVLTLGD